MKSFEKWVITTHQMDKKVTKTQKRKILTGK